MTTTTTRTLTPVTTDRNIDGARPYPSLPERSWYVYDLADGDMVGHITHEGGKDGQWLAATVNGGTIAHTSLSVALAHFGWQLLTDALHVATAWPRGGHGARIADAHGLITGTVIGAMHAGDEPGHLFVWLADPTGPTFDNHGLVEQRALLSDAFDAATVTDGFHEPVTAGGVHYERLFGLSIRSTRDVRLVADPTTTAR